MPKISKRDRLIVEQLALLPTAVSKLLGVPRVTVGSAFMGIARHALEIHNGELPPSPLRRFIGGEFTPKVPLIGIPPGDHGHLSQILGAADLIHAICEGLPSRPQQVKREAEPSVPPAATAPAPDPAKQPKSSTGIPTIRTTREQIRRRGQVTNQYEKVRTLVDGDGTPIRILDSSEMDADALRSAGYEPPLPGEVTPDVP